MNIRAFAHGDQDEIAAIHAKMGLDYKMPDLAAKLVKAKAVCEHNGEIIAATALKMQAETYLWVKPGIHPALKWDAIRLLQAEIIRQAIAYGFEQLVCYVPDCVGNFFTKRLKMLNWVKPRDGWSTWIYEIGGK